MALSPAEVQCLQTQAAVSSCWEFLCESQLRQLCADIRRLELHLAASCIQPFHEDTFTCTCCFCRYSLSVDNVELVMRYALHTILHACNWQSDRHCHERVHFRAVAANIVRLKESNWTSPFACFNAALYCAMMRNPQRAMQVTHLITLQRKISVTSNKAPGSVDYVL